MKILNWLVENILFVFILFLLSFIPLYPKLPLVDVKNTWVYVRLEDFLVVFVMLIWLILFLKRKVSIKTPLTLPIFAYWTIGAIATIHAMLFIFPFISKVFPNVAFLSYLRHIEYLSLFFLGFSSIKKKSSILYIIGVLSLTLLVVSVYGVGQKFFGLPAFLTMNEEFAKGTPIQLSHLSRVPSTFGGHYDFAAYLVLVIPILFSLLFGLKNWIGKVFLMISILFGLAGLYMTISRVSFFVMLISLFFVILFQKKKILICLIPLAIIVGIFMMSFSTRLFDRFTNTLKEITVLVDAKTGQEIGQIRKVPSSNFKNKVIQRRYYANKSQLMSLELEDTKVFPKLQSIVPSATLPQEVNLLLPPNISTGETLPSGTGYVNLLLSPVVAHVGEFFYNKTTHDMTATADTFMFHGDFLIKKATAYDLSFTTRFQGEWPEAILAFQRNIFLGSGFSSASLAVDNNYLRILAETGILGLISFFAIFLVFGVYFIKTLPSTSGLTRSFTLGFVAGVIGLGLNALLIDVFEASKVAFNLWLLMGITVGTLTLYHDKEINMLKEVRGILVSPFFSILYLVILGVTLYSKMVNNFFVGDDFTWLRWVSQENNVLKFFTSSEGFFYRPGAKMYYFIMFKLFWLNNTIYHIVSLGLHIIVSIVIFFLIKKLLKNYTLAILSSILFLLISGPTEAVFWISATGFLFTTLFSLLGLYSFIVWRKSRKNFTFVLTIIFAILSVLFHELGIVTSLLIGLYLFVFEKNYSIKNTFQEKSLKVLLGIIPFYLLIRLLAGSHWFNGDYSYNLLKFPFNFIANAISYVFLITVGTISAPLFQSLRTISKNYFLVFAFLTLFAGYCSFIAARYLFSKFSPQDRRIILFGLGIFIISLLPFLGLGNISYRYSYLASVGIVILIIVALKLSKQFLIDFGKEVSYLGLITIASLYILLHIMQLYQINTDWSEAGDKVKNFLTTVDATYSNYWEKEPVKLYFTKVPIRYRHAWVFPVGLEDAIWFAFKNNRISVYQISSSDQALALITNPLTQKVFEFDLEGRIIEKRIALKINDIK